MTTQKHNIEKSEGSEGNNNRLSENNFFSEGNIINGNTAGTIIPVEYIRKLPLQNMRNNMLLQNGMLPNGMLIKNLTLQNGYTKNDSTNFLHPMRLMNNANFPVQSVQSVQSRLQIPKVFSPKKKKTKLTKVGNGCKKEKFALSDNKIVQMREMCIQPKNTFIVNSNIRRDEYRNVNNNNNNNNSGMTDSYNDVISKLNLGRQQMNNKAMNQINNKTMKQMFCENQFYSRYLETGKNSKNKVNNSTYIDNLDYSLNYMLINKNLQSTVDQEKGPKHISNVFDTNNSFYSDKRNIIKNYNNVNIIQLNVFSNTDKKESTQEGTQDVTQEKNIKSSKSETVEKKRINELNIMKNANDGNCKINKNEMHKDKRNETFPSCKYITSRNNKNISECKKKEKLMNVRSLSLKKKMKETQHMEEAESETETIAETESETDIGWEIDECKINKAIEYSANSPMDQFERANHMSNRSLRKGKKKNMGACLFNFNYLTCQFLLSFDKP